MVESKEMKLQLTVPETDNILLYSPPLSVLFSEPRKSNISNTVGNRRITEQTEALDSD